MRARKLLLISLLMTLSSNALADDFGSATAPYGYLCTEVSDVVGYRRCMPYGTWSHAVDETYVFVDYGTTWRHFPRGGARHVARATTSPSTHDASTSALVLSERIGFALAPGAHAAIEVEIGNFVFEPGESDRDTIIGGLGSIGFLGSIAPLSLGVELAAGYHGYTDTFHRDLVGEGVVEARGRGHLWVTPWFTIGAVAGASLLHRGNWMAGLTVGLHSRAFGDGRW